IRAGRRGAEVPPIEPEQAVGARAKGEVMHPYTTGIDEIRRCRYRPYRCPVLAGLARIDRLGIAHTPISPRTHRLGDAAPTIPLAVRPRGRNRSRGRCRWRSGSGGRDTDAVITSRAASSAPAVYWFPREVIAVAVRWYLRYGLSYRDVEELLAERGVEVDHV